MPLHIGKIIRDIAKKKGMSHAVLAKKINTTRQNIQSITNRETIDTGILKKISEVLEHDFFQYYRLNLEIKEIKQEAQKEDSESILALLHSAIDKFTRLKKSFPGK